MQFLDKTNISKLLVNGILWFIIRLYEYSGKSGTIIILYTFTLIVKHLIYIEIELAIKIIKAANN